MTPLCQKIVHVNVKWRIMEKVSIFGDFFRFVWRKILSCSSIIEKPIIYRRVVHRTPSTIGEIFDSDDDTTVSGRGISSSSDADLVSLKISLLGDCQTGKTTFVVSMKLVFVNNFTVFLYFLISSYMIYFLSKDKICWRRESRVPGDGWIKFDGQNVLCSRSYNFF